MITFSTGGVPFDDVVIISLYRALLGRIETGNPKVPHEPNSILDILLNRHAHVYRDGTAARVSQELDKCTEMRMKALVERCREQANVLPRKRMHIQPKPTANGDLHANVYLLVKMSDTPRSC